LVEDKTAKKSLQMATITLSRSAGLALLPTIVFFGQLHGAEVDPHGSLHGSRFARYSHASTAPELSLPD